MKIVGHREQPRDLVALDEGHQGARVELAQDHVATADHRQEVRRPPAVDMEQRDDVEDDVVLGEAEADLGGKAVQVQLAMGHRHALGQAGRAARVEELGHRVLVDVGVTRVRRAGGEEGLVLVVGDAARLAVEDDDDRPRRQPRQDLLDERHEVAVDEDDLRRRMAEDVLDLVRRQPDVDRVEDGPGLDHAVVRLEQVVGVEGDERDAIAARDPELDERVRQPVGPVREFAVGELCLAVDDADLVAEELRGAVTELEDGQRDEHVGPPCTPNDAANRRRAATRRALRPR